MERAVPMFDVPSPVTESLPSEVKRVACMNCPSTVHVYPFAISAECNSCGTVYRVHADMSITEGFDE